MKYSDTIEKSHRNRKRTNCLDESSQIIDQTINERQEIKPT